MNAVDQIGHPTPEHVAYAASLIAQLPDSLLMAARRPVGARALVLAMLLPRDAALREAVAAEAFRDLDPAVREELDRLLPDADALTPPLRLPLIDLMLPALRRLDLVEYRSLRERMTLLIQADRRVELFEWMLRRLVIRHVEAHRAGQRAVRVRHRSLKPLLDRIGRLLAAVARVGHPEPGAARRAYDAGSRVLGEAPPMPETDGADLDAVGAALDALAEASPRLKKRVIEACAACIAADGVVEAREAELLRAICDALDCPMPPLLPGQPLV